MKMLGLGPDEAAPPEATVLGNAYQHYTTTVGN